jgi:hypothetical protein
VAAARGLSAKHADLAPCDRRSVNRCGHAHLACNFPINVTVPREVRSRYGEKDSASGRDMRTYYCRFRKERVDVDNGVALWKVLSDAREKK